MAPPGVSFSLQIEDQGLVEFDLSAANYKLALTRTLPMTEQQGICRLPLQRLNPMLR